MAIQSPLSSATEVNKVIIELPDGEVIPGVVITLNLNSSALLNKLIDEVIASDFYRYTSINWFGQDQPYQNIYKQYVQYLKNGFMPECEKGVWITCFIAFDNKCPDISRFLDLWYLHIINLTTQDQISFPFVVQLFNIIPYTLPDDEIKAVDTGSITDFYIKADHGR